MKTKKTPERQCISCRNMFPKKDLIRVVKQADGTYFIDETNKSNGRGAYICNKEECISKCIKSKLLNKSFKSNINQNIYESLENKF